MNKEAKQHLEDARAAYKRGQTRNARMLYARAMGACRTDDRSVARIGNEVRFLFPRRESPTRKTAAARSAAVLVTAKKNAERENAQKARERKKSPDGMTASERAMANSEPFIAPRNKPEPDDKPLYISRSWAFAFANGVCVAVQSQALLLETERRMILGFRLDRVASSSDAVAMASAILDKVPAASRIEVSFNYRNTIIGDFEPPVDSRTVIAVQR